MEEKHSYIDSEHLKDVEKVCTVDGWVEEEIKSLDLPEGAEVVIEPWAYATDGLSDMTYFDELCNSSDSFPYANALIGCTGNLSRHYPYTLLALHQEVSGTTIEYHDFGSKNMLQPIT